MNHAYRLSYEAEPPYVNDVLTLEITVVAHSLDFAMLLAEREIRAQMTHGLWRLRSGVLVLNGPKDQ